MSILSKSNGTVKCYYVYELAGKTHTPPASVLKGIIRCTVPRGIPYYPVGKSNIKRTQMFADEYIGKPLIAEWNLFRSDENTWTYFTCVPAHKFDQLNRAMTLAGFIKSDIPF